MKKIIIKFYKYMTKIISKFRNSFTGEEFVIAGAGEGGGSFDPAIVEQIYADLRNEIEEAKNTLQEQVGRVGSSVSSLGGEVYGKFQKHTDDNLIGDDKNLVSVINQLITRVNQLEGYHVLYDGRLTLSIKETYNNLEHKVILENVPSGTYAISSDWSIQTEESPEPYGEISVVAIKAGVEKPYDADTFIGNNNVLEVIGAPWGNNTKTIQVNEPFDLVVYLANNEYIEDLIEGGNNSDAICDVTATINNIKVVKV